MVAKETAMALYVNVKVCQYIITGPDPDRILKEMEPVIRKNRN